MVVTRALLKDIGRGFLVGLALFILYAAVCWELDRITPFIYVVF
jgi:hypothetical protein